MAFEMPLRHGPFLAGPGRVRGLPGERGDLAAAQQPTQLDLSR